VYHNLRVEQEADDAALHFMDSLDVIGDMSRSYGYDFSQVQIHTDEAAAQQTAALGANAFASGNGVFFGSDAFQQHDPASRGLLAHELTHIMQQANAGGVQGQAPVGAPQCGLLDKIRGLFHRKPKIKQIGAAYKGEDFDYVNYPPPKGGGLDESAISLLKEERYKRQSQQFPDDEPCRIPAQTIAEYAAHGGNGISRRVPLYASLVPAISGDSAQIIAECGWLSG